MTDVTGEPVFVCPHCHGDLRDLECRDCGRQYRRSKGIPDFAGDSGRDFYDLISPVYESGLWYSTALRLVGGPGLSRERLVESVTGGVDGNRVLDVACGTGLYTRKLAENADQAYGVDLSLGMLRRAMRYARRDGVRNAWFARADAAGLPFPDTAFDAVVCAGALHIFPDKPGALREIARVLEPGGNLAVTTLVDEGLLGNRVMRGLLGSIGFQVFTREEAVELVEEAGFSDIELETMGSFLFAEAVR